jgi:hypothetical protein
MILAVDWKIAYIFSANHVITSHTLLKVLSHVALGPCLQRRYCIREKFWKVDMLVLLVMCWSEMLVVSNTCH